MCAIKLQIYWRDKRELPAYDQRTHCQTRCCSGRLNSWSVSRSSGRRDTRNLRYLSRTHHSRRLIEHRTIYTYDITYLRIISLGILLHRRIYIYIYIYFLRTKHLRTLSHLRVSQKKVKALKARKTEAEEQPWAELVGDLGNGQVGPS